MINTSVQIHKDFDDYISATRKDDHVLVQVYQSYEMGEIELDRKEVIAFGYALIALGESL